MRILLKKGKQTELILLAKQGYSWKELANKLSISSGYLSNDLRSEKILLSEENYKVICKFANISFDKFITNTLDNNWGRAKGGMNSPKNLKKIIVPKEDERLAEVIGIILGDGHVSEIKEGKKKRCYSIRIAGNAETDRDYLVNYIPNLFEEVFNDKGNIHFSKRAKAGWFTLYGKEFVEFIKSKGIKSGNKKVNEQGIPRWIVDNEFYLKSCIRGLIDTDGSVHQMSKYNLNVRISYTSYITKLLSDVRSGLIKLGFSPSKIIDGKQIFLSRQEEIERYVREVGFSNQKNLNRLKILRKKALVV